MKVTVKSVPDAEPNADGEWITVEISWGEFAELLKTKLPANHHAVAYDFINEL